MRSTRGRVWVILLAGVWAVGACDVATSPPDDPGPPEEAAPPDPAAPQMPAEWPFYRGDPSLVGVAPGELPDPPVLVWTYDGGGAFVASPVVSGGIVFIASGDGTVHAVRLEDGSKVWTRDLGDQVESTALVRDGRVFVGCADSFVYALDAATGAVQWRHETADKILGAVNAVSLPDGDRLVVGSYDFSLYCLAPGDGTELWRFETDNFINGSPAIDAQGRIVFGGCDAVVHVVSPEGKEVQAIFAPAYIAASPAVADGVAYVGHYEGGFFAADLASGDILWEYGEGEEPFFSCPAVLQDRVVVGARDGFVHCMDRKTGERLWAFETQGEVDAGPVACGGRIVVGSGDGFLYILDAATGEKVWSYECGGVYGSAALVDGRILIGADDGRLYCFGSEAQTPPPTLPPVPAVPPAATPADATPEGE